MFKNKRIVAMVLCALMLFVPVAAMANEITTDHDFLKDLQDKTAKAALQDKIDALSAPNGLLEQVENGLKKMLSGKEKEEDFNKRVERFEKKAEELQNLINAAAKLKNDIAGYEKDGKKGYEIWQGTTNFSKKGAAKDAWDTAVKAIDDAQKALNDAKDEYQYVMDTYKNAGLETLKRIGEKIDRAQNAYEAGEAFKEAYEFFRIATYKDLVTPELQRAWKKFLSLATPLEVANFKTANSAIFNNKAVKEALEGMDKKDYVASKEGWRVVNTNKTDYLKDVAELRLEQQKDGKYILKLYNAAGKEIKLDQTLRLWIPLAKGTKLNSVKVDGKAVTAVPVKDGDKTFYEVPADF